MKSATLLYLPPDFDGERILDVLFPERLRDRFRAAEGADCIEDGTPALCRFCRILPHIDCDTCRGAR